MRNLLYFLVSLALCVTALVGTYELYRNDRLLAAFILFGGCVLAMLAVLALYDKLESSHYTLKHHDNCIIQDKLEAGVGPTQFDQLIKGRASRNE